MRSKLRNGSRDMGLRYGSTCIVAAIQATPFSEPNRAIAWKRLNLRNVRHQSVCIGIAGTGVPSVPVNRNKVHAQGGAGIDLRIETRKPSYAGGVGLRCW